ncbi:hypothetical protein COLO4_20247 [Corchorus olitorius]|uniref:Uncharacterized protein n=1 Tax=Corchorus olitorius TaxID=93759 RepID=A0A1R3J0U8_9ROSI|nr:hypothetical protein COLO4_20247 [Corchorus olitorius]
MPEFEKYDGAKNPRDHILSFQNKMAPFSTDDKFLMYSFMFSLTGSTGLGSDFYGYDQASLIFKTGL